MTDPQPLTGGLTDEELALDLRRLDPVRRFLAQHPVISDLLVCALVLFPLLALVVTELTRPAGAVAWLPMVLQVLAAVALAARRFYPLTVAVTVVVLGLVTVYLTVGEYSPVLAISCAIYALAASTRTRYPGRMGITVFISAEVLLLSVVMGLQQSGKLFAVLAPADLNITVSRHPAEMLADLAVLGLGALVIGVSVHNRRQRDLAQVAQMKAAQTQHRQAAETAAAQERHRIANEMHDVVAHSLSVMVALADGARTVAPRDLDAALSAMGDVAQTGREALSEMRQVLGNVTEVAELSPLGGDTDSRNIDELLERVRTAGLEIKYRRTGADLPDDTAIQLAIYRLIQESLTNVLRHAGPSTVVRVGLRHDPVENRVSVSVSNAPPPHPPDRSSAQHSSKRGLLGLRERVELLGGEFLSGPTMAGGWRMQASIPTKHH